ncbi:Uncharacterised protein [Shigella sonnei]|nr:Uncharacterised protein [Shigella sonnei]CSR44829.1 Uncharacterised protein [Shigella sonnei]
MLIDVFLLGKFTAGFVQHLFMMADQVDIATTATGNRFHCVTCFHQFIINSEIGIQQVTMVREQRPEDRQNRFVAGDHRPQRLKD